MSCLASNLITWLAPRSNMIAPSSHGITRPLNSMIGVPALIGRAANKPIPLIGDLRFCHSRFRRCTLTSFPRSLIAGISLLLGVGFINWLGLRGKMLAENNLSWKDDRECHNNHHTKG